MTVVCGIDVGSLRTLSYVAWLSDRTFLLDLYVSSPANPLPEVPREWERPAYIGLDAPQGLPVRGAPRREAGIHPYRKRVELSDEALGGLFRAVRAVMEWAMPIVRQRMEADELPDGHYRDHLRVHRKGGEACPRCGSRISEITAGQRITNFCRRCQG